MRKMLFATAVVVLATSAATAQTHRATDIRRAYGSRITDDDGQPVINRARVNNRIENRLNTRINNRIDKSGTIRTNDGTASLTPKLDDGTKAVDVFGNPLSAARAAQLAREKAKYALPDPLNTDNGSAQDLR